MAISVCYLFCLYNIIQGAVLGADMYLVGAFIYPALCLFPI